MTIEGVAVFHPYDEATKPVTVGTLTQAICVTRFDDWSESRESLGDMVSGDCCLAGAAWDALATGETEHSEVHPYLDGCDWLYGGDVFVEPAFRGQGLGHFIMRELIWAFGRNGVTTIVSNHAGGEALKKYWLDFGFTAFSEVLFFCWEQHPEAPAECGHPTIQQAELLAR